MPHRHEPPRPSMAPSVFAGEIQGYTQAARLSRRETDIMVALIRNITNSEEIAKALGISTHTVNNHLKSIFEKTQTKSKTEILSSFLRFAAENAQSRALFVRKPRVLVIDDEDLICDWIASGLAELGMRTFTLTDPELAVERISLYNIDFVVCDIRMPAMNGMDVLKAVRERYRCWPHFVFITGYPDYTLEECMHHGAVGFVEKPLDLDRLFRTIMEHLVESREDQAELAQANLAVEPLALGNDEPWRLRRGEMGFGGAFIPLDANQLKKTRLGVGSLVDLEVSPEACPETLKVRGQVVWKRLESEADGRKPGLGVKFVKMNEKDQEVFQDYVRAQEISSFIPLGLVEAPVAG